jgi:nitrogen regulatory protein PII
MVEVVVADELANDTVKTIIKASRTGEIGDGRIFVMPVECGYNIRSGERDITPELTAALQ